jgi:hypothetical protein
MEMHDGHESLRGSGHRNIIPNVHGESVVVLLCVLQASVALTWMNFNLSAPVAHLAFYSSRSGGYTVTQGPTGGPWAEKILYHI